MIESEFEYKQYLRNVRGLVDGTCNSYPTYLSAICNHLKLDISHQTITSKEEVKNILDKLKSTGIDTNYWGNCQGEIVNILLKIKNSFLPTKQILIGL